MSSEDKSLLTPDDYGRALDAQSACNLSGIVFSFAQVMQRICNEANAGGHGTEWKNAHPICRLYAEQIVHLTDRPTLDGDTYSKAYSVCMEKSGRKAATTA